MQSDLFGSIDSLLPKNQNKKGDFFEKFRMTLRLDQMLIALIVAMILYTLIFSFGVEQGKKFAWQEIQAERQKREEMIREFRAQLVAYQNAIPGMRTEQITEPVRRVAVAASKNPNLVVPSETTEMIASMQPQLHTIPAATEAAITGKYTIQSVTYKSKTDVEKQLQKLTDAGLKPFVIPSGSFMQVCINGFESKKEASEMLKQLKTKGLVPRDSYVRNLPQDIARPSAV